MDESQNNFAESKKSAKKEYTLYYPLYVKLRKNAN